MTEHSAVAANKDFKFIETHPQKDGTKLARYASPANARTAVSHITKWLAGVGQMASAVAHLPLSDGPARLSQSHPDCGFQGPCGLASTLWAGLLCLG